VYGTGALDVSTAEDDTDGVAVVLDGATVVYGDGATAELLG
jgi:hypothetical protein